MTAFRLSSASGANRLPVLGLIVVAGGFVALALHFVFHGQLNADEGFYLLASQLVREGLRPYQDFGFTQGPVFPYLNIPWLELFGYSLDGQRFSSFAWVLILVVLGVLWLKRRAGWSSAGLFLALLIGCPNWIAFSVKGKTYAFAGVCVLVATIALLARWRISLRWLVFLLAGSLAIGARYPTAGYLIPAGVGLLALTPGWRAKVTVLGCAVAAAAVAWVAFAGRDSENLLYWSVQFHRASTFHFPFLKRFGDFARYAPAVIAAAGLAFARAPKIRFSTERVVVVSLAIGMLANIAAPASYAEYVVPLLPAAALLTAPALADWLRSKPKRYGAAVVAVVLAAGWNDPPELSRDVLQHANEAELSLKGAVPPGSIVLSSMPEIAVGAGMRVPQSLAMGKFALTEDYSAAEATRRLMVTPALLDELLMHQDTKAVVLSVYGVWNFSWSVPSYRPISQVEQHRFQALLKKYYGIIYVNDDYLVFLRRKEPRVDVKVE